MTNFYQKHLFFCTNRKINGKKCCAQADPELYISYAQQLLKEQMVYGPGKIRVTKSGCLGRCKLGPCAVIYPEGVWYRYENEKDIKTIIDEHLINNRVVDNLLIDREV